MGRKTLSLPRVIHFAPEGSEDFAQRIDVAFEELEGFLRNSETKELAEEASQRSRNLFYQTFEDDIFPSWTVVEGDPANEVTYPTNGQAGGKALRHNADGSDLWSVFPENIPFDPDRLYRIRCRARLVAAPSDADRDKFYCGVEGVASDGETLVNDSGVDSHGNQHYFAAQGKDMGAFTLGEWQTFTGYFKGVAASGNGGESSDPSAPGTVHEDVRYIRPLFILNYDDGDGEMEIDYIVVEALTEDPEIELGKAAGQVDETRIADDSVSTPKLQANSVIASKIQVSDLEAVSAQMGTLIAGKILSGKIEISADDEHILLGDATAPLTGKGIFQGLSGGVYQFRAGDPGGAHVIWDGTDLKISGALTTEDLEFDTLTLDSVSATIFLVRNDPTDFFKIGGAGQVDVAVGPLIVGTDPGGSEKLRVQGGIQAGSRLLLGGGDRVGLSQRTNGNNNVDLLFGQWHSFHSSFQTQMELQESGALVIGTDPGGAELLRVGGDIVISVDGSAIDFEDGYNLFKESTGSGSDNSRMWWDAPDGGELTIGPRSGSASLEMIRFIRCGNIDMSNGNGLIIPVGTWPS